MHKLKLIVVSALMSVIAITAPAQNILCDPYTLTNLPSILFPGSSSNVTTTPIRVRQNFPLGVLPYFVCSNTPNGGPLVYQFEGTGDGTNYTSCNLFEVLYRPTNSTATRWFTNISANSLLSLHTVQLKRITNGTGVFIYHTNTVMTRGR